MKFVLSTYHGQIYRSTNLNKSVSKRLIRANVMLVIIFSVGFLVISEFNVQLVNGSDANLVITDNLGAIIPRDKVSDVIRTFYNGSLFYINVSYDWKIMKDSFQLVTPLVSIIKSRRSIFWKLLII